MGMSVGRSPMRGAAGAGDRAAAAAGSSRIGSSLREEGRQPPPPSRAERVSDSAAGKQDREHPKPFSALASILILCFSYFSLVHSGLPTYCHTYYFH